MSRASKLEMIAPRAANAMASERSRFIRPKEWAIAGAGAVALAAAVTALLRHPAARPPVVSAISDARPPTAPAAAAAVAAAATVPAGAETSVDDDKVDALIERARQAMSQRRFIEPATDNALALYTDALLLDPGNGEARQGLQRVFEISITRVQTAIDEHKLEPALRSLEAARSIDAGDPRLAALDAQIAGLRAEFGPDKVNQLGDEARRRREEAAAAQSNKLAEHRARNAAAFVRAAIAERRFSDADALLPTARSAGVSDKVLAALKRELLAARGLQVQQELDQQRAAELTRTQIGQLIDRARAALDAGDGASAQTLLASAAQLGTSPDLEQLREQLARAQLKGPELPQVDEPSLRRLNKLDIQYPYTALRDGTEGWVELSYIVAADGSVRGVKVVSASPARTFEASATKAVSKLKYQPVLKDGSAAAVATRMRIAYRIPN